MPGNNERETTDRLVEATKDEFKILRQIGHGAMGSVYLARDIALSRRVAIKVISPHLLQDEKMVTRFLLEAKTVAALNHPHIVTLHAVRQLGGLYYFVMDFIDGPSLRHVMEKMGPLDLPLVQALLYQVGGALTYAHRRGVGVIHRDVKPANIMIDREGNAVVTDFGIAKIGAEQTGLTQAGSTIGTPAYMSPEQCRGKELTGASDQYALGVMAFEMLAGITPFHGEMMAVMMAHAQEDPPSLRAHRPDCPPMVEAAIFRMMAKSPEDRFPNVAAAVASLGGRPFEHDDPIRAATVDLVQSVSGTATGLDLASPLSPTGGDATTETPSTPSDAATLVLPAREGEEMPPTPEPGETVAELDGLQIISRQEEATQAAMQSAPETAPEAEAGDASGAGADSEQARATKAEQKAIDKLTPLSADELEDPPQFATEWVASQLREDTSPRRRWKMWVAVIAILAIGVSPPVRSRLSSFTSGMSAPTGSGASVGLAAVTDTLDPGGTLQMDATILAQGGFQPDTAATWSSSDAAVATVDRAGLVRARGPGIAVITVVFEDASASTEVVVRPGG